MENKKIIEIKRKGNKTYFPVLWNIGKRCNYACTYCAPRLHDMFSPHAPLETMQKVIHILATQISNDQIKIWWTGGEPSVNPNFHKLIHFIHEAYPNRFVLGATTNGTRKVEYYIDLTDHMQFTFSTHFEYIGDEIVEFSKKIKEIVEQSPKYSVSVNVMLEPNYWKQVKYMIHFFTEHNIKYDLMKIHGGYEHIVYTDEQLKYLDTFNESGSYQDIEVTDCYLKVTEMNANQLVNAGLNDFRGWECDIGKASLYIENDGRVKRASCGVGGYLGNIYTGFTLPSDSVICNKIFNEGRCTCISDIRISKRT